jgi:hypothetical protein
MSGKATLILVMGFTLIFLVYGRNFTQMATDTTKNFASYYYGIKCKNASSVGINILNNRLFFRAGAVDTVFTLNYDGVTVLDSLKTIDAYLNIKKIVSIASISLPHSLFAPQEEYLFTSTTKVIVKPSLFSKYGYFSDNEGSGINWSGRDSILGPFHTNGNLSFSGNSVFTDLVTYGSNISLNGNNPQFLGGKQGNTSIQIPTTGVDTVQSYSDGGHQFTGKSLIYLEFKGDNIEYKYSATGTVTSAPLATFAPNGVISCVNAEVHIKGVIKGKYSVGVSGSSASLTGAGNIWIDDDLTYFTNPRTSASTDMLGIIAEKNIVVDDNPNAKTTPDGKAGIRIEAAMFAQEGSFTVENYSSDAPRGTIYLYGGVVQKTRGAVGTGSGSTMSSGYAKNYKYDNRLKTSYPPHFPGCGSYEIVSWFE